MDRFEYKVRASEIWKLISEGQYSKAAELADSIDWSRVNKPAILCTISDLYKKNRRFDDAIELLHLAYDIFPGGKDIVYSLCELYIKTGDIVNAIATYKEFLQVAAKDTRRYILQYKIYEAQDVSLEERIEVLEELKKRDYREKWAYTLAYLYHRVGLATKCVEECDELIIWFGEGKYVYKAMELKMLHAPLSESQQQTYDHRFDAYMGGWNQSHEPASDPEAKPEVNTNAVETANVVSPGVNAAADGRTIILPEIPHADAKGSSATAAAIANAEAAGIPADAETVALTLGYTQVYHGQDVPQDNNIQVKTVDVGQYNTINLQNEIAKGVQEVLNSQGIPATVMSVEDALKADTRKIPNAEGAVKQETEETAEGTISDAASKELSNEASDVAAETVPDGASNTNTEEEKATGEAVSARDGEAVKEEEIKDQAVNGAKTYTVAPFAEDVEVDPEIVKEAISANPPEIIADKLTQEPDGQIKFVLPEAHTLAKQITGQMSISDVMEEWDKMKREHEERNRRQYRDQMLQRTGALFDEFDAASGVLESLEREAEAESRNAANNPTELKDTEIIVDSDEEGGEELPEIIESEPEEYPDSNRSEEGYFDEAAQETEETWEEDSSEENSREDEGAQEENLQDTEEISEEDVQGMDEVSEEDGQGMDEVSEEDGQGMDEVSEEDGQEPEDNAEATTSDTEDNADDTIVEEISEITGDISEEAKNADDEQAEASKSQDIEVEVSEVSLDEIEAAEEVAAEKKSAEKKSAEKKGRTDAKAKAEQKNDKSAKEAAEDAEKAENASEADSEEEDSEDDKSSEGNTRELTHEEMELFGPYIQTKSARRQLIGVLDGISMASYTGNVILTGNDATDTTDLATKLMKDIRQSDSNFSGKVAKISARNLNNKKVSEVLKQLSNGALIVEKASAMNNKTVNELIKAIDQENRGIIITLIDSERNMDKFLESMPKIKNFFTARMNLKALSADQLASFGKKYAYEMEYSIDEMGMLALHTQIDIRQTPTHSVNVVEVKEIVDNAIGNAKRKNVGHFFDVLFGKRYDDEDMIVLGEKDFR